MAHLPHALQSAEQEQNNLDAGIIDMFDSITPVNEVRELPECEPWDEKTRLILEKESLGLFLTGHPLQMVEDEVRKISPVSLGQWLQRLDTGGTTTGVDRYRQKDQPATVCGLVVDIRMRNGFKGREAFVTLDDRSGRVDVRVSPEMLTSIESIVQKDLVWVVGGGIAYDDFNNGIKFRAANVSLLDDYRAENARALHITIAEESEENLTALIEELKRYQSSAAMPVVFHMRRQNYSYQLRTNGGWSLKPDEHCLMALQRTIGKDDFYFEYQ
jgi:DNA polymerase-3 subunit alpha